MKRDPKDILKDMTPVLGPDQIFRRNFYLTFNPNDGIYTITYEVYDNISTWTKTTETYLEYEIYKISTKLNIRNCILSWSIRRSKELQGSGGVFIRSETVSDCITC